jgi:hypothetical protein
MPSKLPAVAAPVPALPNRLLTPLELAPPERELLWVLGSPKASPDHPGLAVEELCTPLELAPPGFVDPDADDAAKGPNRPPSLW